MSQQTSFTLIPVRMPFGSEAKEQSTTPPNESACSHYLITSSPERHHTTRKLSRVSECHTDNSKYMHHHQHYRSPTLQSDDEDTVCQNISISGEHAQETSQAYNDGQEEDNSTIATESSLDSSPPLSFIRVPALGFEANLSKEDWRNMYLSSQHAKRKLHRLTVSVLDENRALKRQLIQLQKRVNETRRSHVLATKDVQPWSIPLSAPKRRRISLPLEQKAPHCVSVEGDALTCML
jgi:predicted NodU family carbamoyl transferase